MTELAFSLANTPTKAGSFTHVLFAMGIIGTDLLAGAGAWWIGGLRRGQVSP
jgi:cytochrome bd-type quinol oxidase subunit 1